MKNGSKEKHESVSVKLSDLQIDRSYQRSDYINNKIVKLIGGSFDPLLCGVVTVGKRADGSMWVVDGQHRVLGAKKAKVERLPCVVFDSRGPEHEASVFYELNARRTGINCISMYRALLTQREQATVEIQQLLEKYGFDIGRKTGEFGAATTIRETYKSGVLDRVLFVIKESFGGDSRSWKWMFGSTHFVQMLAMIYKRKGDKVSDERMALVLARLPYQKYQELAAACNATSGSRAANICPRFISEYYNYKLTKNRIDWYGE